MKHSAKQTVFRDALGEVIWEAVHSGDISPEEVVGTLEAYKALLLARMVDGTPASCDWRCPGEDEIGH